MSSFANAYDGSLKRHVILQMNPGSFKVMYIMVAGRTIHAVDEPGDFRINDDESDDFRIDHD
ncbi:hypothetical protein CHH67_03490 [Paenibacillus campinasensis]|uniref:Uncharacterized protein n=1 Tax=Paenibacillus campinasensis TaxID=66347 RepID=A0A268F348_9BACL|nr:hypothetical protein CHH67_03490 [Paenibacillus campinasensis]